MRIGEVVMIPVDLSVVRQTMPGRRSNMFPRLTMSVASGPVEVLDGLLSGTRARGGVFNLTILDQPWGLHIVDRAALALAPCWRAPGG
jgi:hypothetical protein